MTATDPEGDEITYVLGDDAGSKFRINNKTGEVFVNAVLTKKVKDTFLTFSYILNLFILASKLDLLAL